MEGVADIYDCFGETSSSWLTDLRPGLGGSQTVENVMSTMISSSVDFECYTSDLNVRLLTIRMQDLYH